MISSLSLPLQSESVTTFCMCNVGPSLIIIYVFIFFYVLLFCSGGTVVHSIDPSWSIYLNPLWWERSMTGKVMSWLMRAQTAYDLSFSTCFIIFQILGHIKGRFPEMGVPPNHPKHRPFLALKLMVLGILQFKNLPNEVPDLQPWVVRHCLRLEYTLVHNSFKQLAAASVALRSWTTKQSWPILGWSR